MAIALMHKFVNAILDTIAAPTLHYVIKLIAKYSMKTALIVHYRHVQSVI